MNDMEKAERVREIIDLQRRLNWALNRYATDAWLSLNLTVAQLKSLFFIATEGGTNSRELAKALRVTPSNVTGIVDRLVQQGMVSRKENPDDRRMLQLRATDQGEKLLADLRERRTGHLSHALERLGLDELNTIARGLAMLVETIEVHGKKKQEVTSHEETTT